MLHLLLLVIHLCIVGTISQTVIRGIVGQEITLPCTYNAQHGTHHMCWGRGHCPDSKCNNEILLTNERRVTSRASIRYQLKGLFSRGDVSLTIVNLKEGDTGMYCCRVEVPGWFNDLKKTLRLQVARATTTTSRATTKSYPVSTTTTSAPLTTTVTPQTTPFLLTNPPLLTIPTVAPLTTDVPPTATSSVTTAIEFLTGDPPFVNISPSTTHLQITYGYDYNFPTTASEIATPPTVTTPPPATLLIPSNTENIDNWPTSATITIYPATISNPSHTVATSSSKPSLTTTVTTPTTSPVLKTTTSSSSTVPAVAVPVTNVSSISTSSTSTAAAILIASPSLVNIKPPLTSPQQDFTENVCSPTTEAVASPTGIERLQMIFTHNRVAISCAVVVLVLLLALLVLLVKRKKIRKYLFNGKKSIKKLEEPETMLLETERDNGLFTL